MQPVRFVTITAIDSKLLIPAKHHFNCAISEWRNHYALAYRIENEPVNEKTRIAICELDERLQPLPGTNRLLNLPTIYGFEIAEDPRLIKTKGHLYCSYTDRGSLALALLSNDLTVTGSNYIYYDKKADVEKNWGIFEHGSSLMAVYTIQPHRIVELNLDFERGHLAHFRYEVSYSFDWLWGEPRGGSSPVRVGDEYFCFFHSHYIAEDLSRIYVMGAYAFEAEPPFKVTRFTRFPVLSPPLLPIDERAANGHLVVFPCGAVHQTGTWFVSYGENDLFCRICTFQHELLLGIMERIETNLKT